MFLRLRTCVRLAISGADQQVLQHGLEVILLVEAVEATSINFNGQVLPDRFVAQVETPTHWVLGQLLVRLRRTH